MTMILLILFACTMYMTGVIWFVQLAHYPLIHADTPHHEYTKRMGLVVGPVMIAEMTLQIVWMIRATSTANLIALLLLVVIWISTFFVQVPLHRALEMEHDTKIVQKLVRSNWLRTLCWTARAVLLGILLHDYV